MYLPLVFRYLKVENVLKTASSHTKCVSDTHLMCVSVSVSVSECVSVGKQPWRATERDFSNIVRSGSYLPWQWAVWYTLYLRVVTSFACSFYSRSACLCHGLVLRTNPHRIRHWPAHQFASARSSSVLTRTATGSSSQSDAVQTPTSYFYTIHFNIILLPMNRTHLFRLHSPCVLHARRPILDLIIIVRLCTEHSETLQFNIHRSVHRNISLQYNQPDAPAAIGDEVELRSTSSPIAAGSSSCLTYTVAVYAVLSSWRWTERPPETCRAFYKNK